MPVRIVLRPMGTVDKGLIEAVAFVLRDQLGLFVNIGAPAPKPGSFMRTNRRRQFNPSRILTYLDIDRETDDEKVLGFVLEDIAKRGYDYNFGLAEISGPAGVVSLFRLASDDRELLIERAGKEAVHEIGHLFGLDHCGLKDCAMHFSQTIEDTDRRPVTFCADHLKQFKESLEG